MPAIRASEMTRRNVLAVGTASTLPAVVTPAAAEQGSQMQSNPTMLPVSFEVNEKPQALTLDARTTLLDALREHLHLTGALAS